MYHSIQFIRPEDIHSSKPSNEVDPYVKDTYNDWSLVPTTRPSVAPPVPKTKYVDIPGSNSQLDFSTSLTGYPVYQNRTGSWEFMIDLDKNNKPWSELYSEIMDWLQGKEMCCILEDDQSWYYKGRFYVEGLNSQDKYTTVTINYNVYPYKKYAVLGADYDADWLWDTFDFIDGIIPGMTIRNISVDSENEYKQFDIFTNNSDEWYEIFGTEPVIPIIKVTTPSEKYIQIKFRNNALNKPTTEYESDQLTTGMYELRNIMFGGRCLEQYIPKYYPGTRLLMGDSNSDGNITSADASRILAYVASLQPGGTPLDPPMTADQLKVSDMNFDGQITSVDASYVLKLYTALTSGDLIANDNYCLSINNTLSIKFKGKGTISFLFVPGRL